MVLGITKMFLFLSLILFTNKVSSQGLTYEVIAPEKVGIDCGSANISIKITGGKAPFTVYWYDDYQEKELPHSSIKATFNYEIPNSYGPKTLLFAIRDGNGLLSPDTYTIDITNSACTAAISNININYKNAIETVGDGCGFDGECSIINSSGTFNGRLFFRYLNEFGDIIYKKDKVASALFSNHKFKLLTEDLILFPMSEIMYLEIGYSPFDSPNSDPGHVVWVEPIKVFTTKSKIIFDDEINCRPAEEADFNNHVTSIPNSQYTPLNLSAGSICIHNPTAVPSYGISYGINQEFSKAIGIDFNLFQEKAVGVTVGGQWTWTDGIVSQQDVIWELTNYGCDKCYEEDENGNKIEDCNIRKNGAAAIIPFLNITTRQKIVEVELMDCEGQIQTETVTQELRHGTVGLECTNASLNCPTPCNDKRPVDRFELPDPQRGKAGYLLVEMENGVAPFEYHWTVGKPIGKGNKDSRNAQRFGDPTEIPFAGNIVTDIEEGEYCVSIYDSECCQKDTCIIIPCLFEMDVTVQDAECPAGIAGGSITLNSIDGIEPITYSWSNGATTKDIDDLAPGVYEVVAIDADSCYFMESIEVSETTTTTITPTLTQPSVCASNGSIALSVTGKGTFFEYLWSTGSTSSSINNLSAGEYCVTVTDITGCRKIECFTLEALTPMEADLDVKHVCGEVDNGEIDITVSGGNPPYSYWWNSGHTGSSATDLSPGVYVIIITDADGCELWKPVEIKTFPALNVYSNFDIPCNGEGITASVNVSGGTSPYSYLWSNGNTTNNLKNATPGFYTVDITDANGCTASADFDLNYTGEIVLNPTITPYVLGCDNNSGSILLNATGGKKPYYYFIQGPGIEQETTDPFFDNLVGGTYFIRCADACGNSIEEYFVVETVQNEFPFSFSLNTSPSCPQYYGSNNHTGQIDLQLVGSGSFEYQWSNGATTQDLVDVPAGNYQVTVTNSVGCEKHGSATVESLPWDLDYELNTTNSCDGMNNGTAEIVFTGDNEYTLWWFNGSNAQSVSNLAPGDYYVNIVNSYGCVYTREFTIGSSIAYNYTIDINRPFNYNNQNGEARVYIQSEIHESGGSFELIETGQTSGVWSLDPLGAIFNIPNQYSNVDVFHFIYTAPNGCQFEGTFEVSTCTFPDNGLDFEPILWGDTEGSCGPGKNNTYHIVATQMGNNHPYYIEITMKQATDPMETDFKKIVTMEEDGDVVAEGIPDGHVKFRSFSGCENETYAIETHRNCCIDFNCDFISQFSNPEFEDGIEVIKYPFVKITLEEPCFDPNCLIIFDNNCSRIHVDPLLIQDDLLCWDGYIEVGFPDGYTIKYEVYGPDQPGPGLSYGVNWITGEDEPWDVPDEGSYTISLSYEGIGDSEGQDCYQEFDVTFNEENMDMIVMNNQTEFLNSVPAPYQNAYFQAFNCQKCGGAENTYIYNNNHDACESFANSTPIFFDFVPNDYKTDPCNSGGTIQIMHFDNNGNAITEEVTVANTVQALHHLEGRLPFNFQGNYSCNYQGWCLFDAIDVYGIPMNRPIWATYGDNCVENSDPPCGIFGCPTGQLCIDGECLPECDENGECETGECIDGVCIEDCDGDCPPEECFNGECLDYVCDYHIARSPDHKHVYRKLFHNLPEGTTIKIEGSCGNDEWWSIEGAVDFYEYCREEDGPNGMQRDHIVKFPNEYVILNFYQDKCGEDRNNWFDFTFSCDYGKQEVAASDTRNNGNKISNIKFYPNPFENYVNVDYTSKNPEQIDIEVSDIYGQKILSKPYRTSAGSNTLRIDLNSDLPSGVYYFTLKNTEGRFETFKLLHIK